MAFMTEGQGREAMAQAIADHITGAKGSLTTAASVLDILNAIQSGSNTEATLQGLVDFVGLFFIPPP